MSKRSDFPRRKHDAYQTTDQRAVEALRPFINGFDTFAAPCCGDGHLIRSLEAIGLKCVLASDIQHGTDALGITDFCGADAIIENPPWSRDLLHAMILHFQKHALTWLLFDSDWAYNKSAKPYLDQCSHIVAVGRLCWLPETGVSGKDNCAWFCFDKHHVGGPHFFGRS